MNEKVCKKCGHMFPLSMFHKNKNTKDGHINTCKECVKKYSKKYNDEHRDDINKRQNQYYYEHKEEELLRRKEYQKTHKEQIAIRKKIYRKEHIEEIKQRDLRYREIHKERYIKNGRTYYQNHHNELLKQKRQYYVKNKESIIAKNQIRRARIRAALGSFTSDQMRECIKFFNNVCAYSGKEFSKEKINCLSLDHIISLVKGGSNFIWNIVPTTFSNNSSKGSKEMIEWYKNQPFYSEERLQRILEWQEYAYQKWGSKNIAC